MKKSATVFLGFDFGATSGRAILGSLRDGRVELQEMYRFPNQPIEVDGTLCWDFPSLWRHVTAALQVCSQAGYSRLSGIGVDTWGVDFGLLDSNGKLLSDPVHYRDGRTERIEENILGEISPKQLFRLTGRTAGRVSTFAQIVALKSSPAAPLLHQASHLLPMPDLFRYFLSGNIACERTAAGTTQLLNIRTGRWAQSLFRTFRLPRGVMPKLIESGTVVDSLQEKICKQCGIQSAPIIAVAGHDTASAVAATPTADADTIFINSGTWSMMGVRRSKPILSDDASRLGFINMPGFRSMLLIKGVMGLYLLENMLRSWSRQGCTITYFEMIRMASLAKPFQFFIDVNSPSLFSAGENAEERIITFLRQTGQKKSPGKNDLLRLLLEGLAFATRQVVNDLQQLAGLADRPIQMLGGGSQNPLLCQFTANATGLEVMAGPVEATVIGNLAIQALATGHLKDPMEIPALVARSCQQEHYQPCDMEEWDRQFKRYKEITTKANES